MRYLILSSLGYLLSFVTLAQSPLTATVRGTRSGVVYFSHGTTQDQKTDSALIDNHQFTLIHYQPFVLYSIWFKDQDKTQQKLILYPAAHIEFDANFDLTISDKDSINHLYQQFRVKHLAFIDDIGQLSYETDKPAIQDSLYKERAKVYNAYLASFANGITAHRANIAAATALYDLVIGDRLQPPSMTKDAYRQFAEPVLDSYYGKKIGHFLNLEQQLSTGSVAPTFQLPSRTGSLVNLSQQKGKYVLLSFWASWCGPCRVKNKQLVSLSAKSSRTLQLLSVSLDTNQKRWLEASEKDQITWLNVCDLKGFSSPAAQVYNINGVPKTFLLSPEGVILGSDLSVEEIEKLIH